MAVVKKMLWRCCCSCFMLIAMMACMCSSRPLRHTLNASSQDSMAWTSTISAKTNELMVSVADFNQQIPQGPCTENTADLVPLQYQVQFTRNAGAHAAGSPNTATVTTSFQTADNQRLILQPCKIVRNSPQPELQSQLQLQQASQLQEGDRQMLEDTEVFNYTAYFRPLPRTMCGKMPKAVIIATIESTSDNQPPQTFTSEVDLVLWGCAFLVGDASAKPMATPPGMTEPHMKAASAETPSLANSAAPVLM